MKNNNEEFTDIPLMDLHKLLAGKKGQIVIKDKYILVSYNVNYNGIDEMPNEYLLHLYVYKSDPAKLIKSIDRNEFIDLVTLPLKKAYKELIINDKLIVRAYQGKDNKADVVKFIEFLI